MKSQLNRIIVLLLGIVGFAAFADAPNARSLVKDQGVSVTDKNFAEAALAPQDWTIDR